MNLQHMVSYSRVETQDGCVERKTIGIFKVGSDAQIEPLEIELEADTPDTSRELLFKWENPWPLMIVSLFVMLPILIANMRMIIPVLGRIWPATGFMAHGVGLFAAIYLSCRQERSRLVTCVQLLVGLSNVILFGWIYPYAWTAIVEGLLTEPDGRYSSDWQDLATGLERSSKQSRFAMFLEVATLALAIFARVFIPKSTFLIPSPFRKHKQDTVMRRLRWISLLGLSIMLAATLFGLYSMAMHLDRSWTGVDHHVMSKCDDMDETECAFPFPSFHHMIEDTSTETGWRVNLRPDQLPSLRGNVHIDMSFLNNMDGFSTMAPLLFYMQGLKEAHEAGSNQLKGQRDIEKSTTMSSVTLLLDVEARKLVYHAAEIDYLDAHHPLVMVFPARPLKHAAHYALAVVNAKDTTGKPLETSAAMARLYGLDSKSTTRENRLREIVLPSLYDAAEWISDGDVQMLFDFVTVSEKIQLGAVRAVRDKTMNTTSGWEWNSRIKTRDIINYNCSSSLVARSINARIQVPWFLSTQGSGSRYSVLKENTPNAETATEWASFDVHIPCSLKNAALGLPGGIGLRAILEFGHGLFSSRAEASESHVLELANREGYVVIAMDWRGMSNLDLLVVIKVLMAQPSLFQAVRDNLIQGFGCKYALLVFAKRALLTMPWFLFESDDGSQKAIPNYSGVSPTIAFYGISQGGILGAGYTALSAPANLIDRAVLGVPGTPFALIMTRSLDFRTYDRLLMLNFATNRHVRMFLSIIQMAWDSVEAAGVLAPPYHETTPPPTLLQAGLGDVIVPALAAEALARAYNATLSPNAPHDVFGLTRMEDSNRVLTELVYDEVYERLPLWNIQPPANDIHYCLRYDPAIIDQIALFVNTGVFKDICMKNSCHRSTEDIYRTSRCEKSRMNHSSSP